MFFSWFKRKKHKAKMGLNDSTGDDSGNTTIIDDDDTGCGYQGGLSAVNVKISEAKPGGMSWSFTVNGNLMIGRSPNCAIQLSDQSVSKEQCKLVPQNGGLVIIQVGNSNITKVNGMQINGRAQVFTGDTIKCGRVLLRVDMIKAPNGGDGDIGTGSPEVGLDEDGTISFF